ncbi:MAG: DUF3857 domain-containing protein [Candidatus Edwardsbacteria bacterium]|nr:DUF3857 domain-containing protein [Candidatus Edwardsbacteria bacterium]
MKRPIAISRSPRRWLPLALLPLLSGILPAGSDPLLELLKTAPGRERYPQARAVVLEDATVFDYSDPSRVLSRERLVVKLLDQRGVDAWGFIRREFDAAEEELRIVRCRTIAPDGRIIVLPDNAANTVGSDAADQAPEYGGRQELVITPVGLEPGAVIELELERTGGRDTADGIAGERVWQGEDPCLRQSLVLRVPRGRTILRWRSSKVIRETFTHGRGVTQWEWRVDSLPAIPPEEDRPDDAALSPRLLFSDRLDWTRAAAGFAADFLPAAGDTAELSPLADSITKGDTSLAGRIDRIASHLNRAVRLVDIPFGEGGYQASRPAEVAANRYADDTDRAALFAALLKACGITVHPVLSWEGDEDLVREVPDVARLGRILLAVERPGGPLFVDPANNDRRPAYLGACTGRKGLLVRSARDVSWVDLPVAAAGANAVTLSGRLVPAKGSWRAMGTMTLRGRYDQRWRASCAGLTPAERQRRDARAFRRWSAQAQEVRLAAPDHEDAGAAMDLSFGCTLKDYGRSQGAITVLRVPDLPIDDLDLLPRAGSDRRRLPLATDGPLVQELDWHIDLPRGYVWAALPDSVSADNEVGSLRFAAAAEDSAVRFTSRIELKLATVPPERHAQLRELLDAYHAPARWHLLLEKRRK